MKSINKLIIAVFFLSVMSACGNKKEAAPVAEAEEAHHDENAVELTPEQFKMAQIELGKISMKALSGTIKVNGMLDLPPQSLVSISTPFEGMVKSTDMLQGMKVKKARLLRYCSTRILYRFNRIIWIIKASWII